jgi:hypothetical protein
MNIYKFAEYGYDESLIGMALSYYQEGEDIDDWIATRDLTKLAKTGAALIRKGPDHGKWIRGINTYWIMRLPRYIWTELDTYKIGTVRLSASTMHTLTKRAVRVSDFEPSLLPEDLEPINRAINAGLPIDAIKARLPEGYLQTGLWVANYQTLRAVISQRNTHRLPQWHTWISEVASQVDHPELLK